MEKTIQLQYMYINDIYINMINENHFKYEIEMDSKKKKTENDMINPFRVSLTDCFTTVGWNWNNIQKYWFSIMII